MKTRGALVVLALAASAVSVALMGGASASHVYPATSQSPTAGYCDGGYGRVVTIKLYSDMSAARCYEVTKSEHLRFVNRSKHAMRLRAPFLRFTLQPGEARTIPGPVGSYLAPGAHSVGSSAWCCFGFDIYLPGAPTPAPTGGMG